MGFFDELGGALGLNKGKGENVTNPYERDQRALVDRLARRANGYEPSMAQEQSNQALGKSLQSQVSAIRSSPGLNPALQARLINQAGQQNASDIVQQGTLARIAEREGADNALGQALFNAGSQEMARQNSEAQNENARRSRFGQVASGAGQGVAAYAAMSDEREKENISDSDGKASDFLNKLKGKLYEYKDESNGPGVHVGIMAQDLEKTPLGKAMVFEEDGAKKVDYGKGFGAVLAAMTEINDRLKELEGNK